MSFSNVKLSCGFWLVSLSVVATGCGETRGQRTDGGDTPGVDASNGATDAGTSPVDEDGGGPTTPDAGGAVTADGGLPDLDAGPPPPSDAGPPESCTTPGTIERLACGMCGERTRFCTSGGFWEYTPCNGEHGECLPGSSRTTACGRCGMQAQRCSTLCLWQNFEGCTAETGMCTPGTSERTDMGCPMGQTRVRTCGATCGYGEFGACAGPPTDFDRDGSPQGTDCDDTDPTIRVGSTEPCGSFVCPGFGGSTIMTGSRTCIGPGYSACMRPDCFDPPVGAMCTSGSESRSCATTGLTCGFGTQTRRCSGGFWTDWSPCSTTSPRPDSCAPTMSSTCGACGEGVIYQLCDRSCFAESSQCLGARCTPGARARTTDGCPAGSYRETTCDATCTPSAPGACMPLIPAVDVMILADMTGSHGPNVRSAADAIVTNIVDALGRDADVRIGVALFADFPVSTYGSTGDIPFRGVLAPTNDLEMVRTAVRGLETMSGGDVPESGVEALHVLAGGAPHPMTEPFVCSSEPGGCWRSGSQRVVLMLTDAVQHNGPSASDSASGIASPYDATVTPTPASWAATRALMQSRRVALFAIMPTFDEDAGRQMRRMIADLGQEPTASIAFHSSASGGIAAASVESATQIATFAGITR